MKNIHLSLKLFFVIALLAFPFLSYGQEFVSGYVYDKDSNNEPLIGVTVMIGNTGQGTITDIDGAFSVSVESGQELSFSFIGYKTQTVVIADQKVLKIYLESDIEELGEVVAIGYGTQKKKEVTGSVASIKSKDFNAGVKTNPVGLLQGKVAGLNIIKTSSDPTSTGYNIQIRGFSTLDKGAGTSPLYVVDGIPVDNIDNISQNEIASMDVLKDGSAAAIYGTRGTNGVILITTKKGEGFGDCPDPKLEYSASTSFSYNNSNWSMATPDEFVNLENISDGVVIPVLYTDGEGNVNTTDWVDEVTRDVAVANMQSVAISGASRKLSYRASFSYKNAQGIAKTSERNEYIGKIKASQKALDDWLNLDYDLSYMHYRNDYFCGSFKQAAIVNPTYPVYDSSTESGYYYPQGSGQSNPVEDMNNRESYGDGNFFRGSVKATVFIKPIPGLKVSAFAAIEEGDNRSYWSVGTVNTDASGSGSAGRSFDSNYNHLYEGTADYVKQWGRHTLTGVAGYSYQNFLYDGMSASNNGFPTASYKYYSLGDGDASKDDLSVSSYRNSNTLVAMFARANYNYDDKYLASASIRREGSSRFGNGNKWGYFPAISLGWRVTNEDFMSNVSWCNDLKVRLGFGVTGNNLASDLQSVELLSQGGSFWYNGQYVFTYTVAQNVNEDLHWEKKYEYNFGVDYELFKSRIFGSVDTYYRKTTDLLWEYNVSQPPYQYSTLLANAGQMDSYGLEIVFNAVAVQKKDLKWTTTPTISFNHNKIMKLSDPDLGFNYEETTSGGVGENGIQNTNTQILIEGESVGAFYGYHYMNQRNASGEKMYKVASGGYKSEKNLTPEDRYVIGNAQPLFTYGWNNTVTYKDFDLTVFFRGVFGNDVLNVMSWAYGATEPNSKTNITSQSMNVYMPSVENATYTDKSFFSDEYLEDGSYIKLDNITLGYNVPIKENSYVKSCRVYASGQNLVTITKYTGITPEINTTGVWDTGIDDCDFYPTVATLLFGVNITFK